MRWKRLLIDIPVLLVDGWFRVYFFIVTALTMVTVTVVVLAVILALFGVRWGW